MVEVIRRLIGAHPENARDVVCLDLHGESRAGPTGAASHMTRDASQRGELGTDLWRLGRLWGGRVARVWTGVVRASLDQVKDVAEERAEARGRRG